MTKSSATRRETDSFGAIEVPAERLWGAQTQRSLENFPIGEERMPRAVIHALGLVKQAAALTNEELGLLPRAAGAGDRRRGGGSRGGRPRRRIPAQGLADRLGHPDEHECERGDRQPRQRKARRTPRRQVAGPPQRPRQSRTIVERFVPERDAYCRRAGDSSPPAAGAGAPRRRAGGQERRLRRRGQDRPHPFAGRDADHARPGILRLGGAGRARARADRSDAAGSARLGAGRDGGRHGLERRSALRRSCSRAASRRSPACRSSPPPTSSRRSRRTTRWSSPMAR